METAMTVPIASLIVLERDAAEWPAPHRAEVPSDSVSDWCSGLHGWAVADVQPNAHVGRVVELTADEIATGGAVAVLCPGPSLSQAWALRGRSYASVVAVNRAAFADGCDWWCCLDDIWNRWGNPDPFPRVGLCGSVRGLAGEAKALLPRNGIALVRCDAPEGCPSFSGLAAIGFAFGHLRAASVDVYGCDLSGHSDYTGEVRAAGREDARWKAEAEGLAVLRARYRKKLRIIAPVRA